MITEQYDLAIIGAGSVGLIAAEFAVKLGARVAMKGIASVVTVPGRDAFPASLC